VSFLQQHPPLGAFASARVVPAIAQIILVGFASKNPTEWSEVVIFLGGFDPTCIKLTGWGGVGRFDWQLGIAWDRTVINR
jgi:hypothetical protein